MRQLPPGLQEHLDTGATTMCRCWLLTRNDGVELGFTDHDRDIEFNGSLFRASTGFTAGSLNETLGLNTDNMDVDGILSSESLSEDDLGAGLYDNAAIELYLVNWRDTTQHLLLTSGSIGEVKRGEHAFTAEIRGLAHQLQQPKGRLYQYVCDANLGDSRCGVNPDEPAFKGTGSVQSVSDERTFIVAELEAFATDWFAGGMLEWTSGSKQGHAQEVKFHSAFNGVVTLELWQKPVFAIEPGDTFTVTAGCDRQFATCRTKFSNALNFRGFPHIPGNDFALSYPNRDDGNNDGGSMNA